jgi:glycerol kinase
MALIAIDQGTTSTRAILFDDALAPLASAQRDFRQIFPRPGWVEHDPEDLWATTVATVAEALARAGVPAFSVAGIGIANQRETVVVWERATGKAIANAIVWQDRRTAGTCARMRGEGLEPEISRRTGLVLDPYFSATKLAWLLDHVEGSRARAELGELAFGTVDAYLISRLTGGRVHATDATNASRTLLYDLERGAFDESLCEAFGAPVRMLPEIRDSAGSFGETLPELFGASIPILGVAGDQQAATAGQACFAPGDMKVTYGTGAFALLHTGERPAPSANKLLSTVALQLNGRRSFALEGAIFVAGAAVQWLRDGLRLVREASETEALARLADPDQDVYLVPAFVGLGAPHWDADAKAALIGLTRGSGAPEIARAALEAVGYQTSDLLAAMRADWPGGGSGAALRVDGGMTANDWMLQFLADILDRPVDRPTIRETTALGAAYLAGLSAGLCPGPEAFAERWRLDRRFEPNMPAGTRRRKLAGWTDAVARVKTG